MYVPEAQGMHVVDPTAFAGFVEHDIHVLDPLVLLYVLGGHSEQFVLPGVEKDPAGHDIHTLAPDRFPNIPAAQRAQLARDTPAVGLDVPGEHSVHAVEPMTE